MTEGSLAPTEGEIARNIYAAAVVAADKSYSRAMFRLEQAGQRGEFVHEATVTAHVSETLVTAMVMLLRSVENEPDIHSIDGWVVRAYVIATGNPPGFGETALDPQTCSECGDVVRVTLEGMCRTCRRAKYVAEEAEDQARESSD